MCREASQYVKEEMLLVLRFLDGVWSIGRYSLTNRVRAVHTEKCAGQPNIRRDRLFTFIDRYGPSLIPILTYPVKTFKRAVF